MQIQNSVLRRTFLTQAMVGGVASVLTVTASADGNDESQECGTKADALMLFIELLLDVQQNAITEKAKATFSPARDCEKILCELSEKITALKAEICQSPKSKKAQQMQNLVEAGRVNAKLLERSPGSPEMKFASLADSLNTINGLIDEAAKDVETECQFVLTDKGKRLLREIMELVEANRELCGKIATSQRRFAEDVELVQCQIRTVKHYIIEAATAITKGEVGKADESINKAVDTLLKLDSKVEDQRVDTAAPIKYLSGSKSKKDDSTSIDHPSTDIKQQPVSTFDCKPHISPLPPGNPTEILIGLLRGTQELVKNPDARPKVSRNGTDQGRVLFKTVAAHSGRNMLQQDIGSLLDNFCKPYTYFRRAVLTVAVDVAWTTYRSKPKERLASIAWTISKMGCDEPSNPNELARRLA